MDIIPLSSCMETTVLWKDTYWSLSLVFFVWDVLIEVNTQTFQNIQNSSSLCNEIN